MDHLPASFNDLVRYSLRIELLNGKTLIYPVTAESKDAVANRLRNQSEPFDDAWRPFPFLWFETVKQRQVIIASGSIARLIVCFDAGHPPGTPVRYHDNFGVLGKEPVIEEMETGEGEGETEMVVFGNDPPQVLVYHKGLPPDDGFSDNPLWYNDLEEGCLDVLALELDGAAPLRRFISLTDEDGEENFISLEAVMVMEFDANLLDNGMANDAGPEDKEAEGYEDDDDAIFGKDLPGDAENGQAGRKTDDLPW